MVSPAVSPAFDAAICDNTLTACGAHRRPVSYRLERWPWSGLRLDVSLGRASSEQWSGAVRHRDGAARRGVRSELGDFNRRIELAWQRGIEDRQAAAELALQLVGTETSLAKALQLREQMSRAASRLPSEADSFVQRFEVQQQARQRQQALERQAAEEQRLKLERAAQAKLRIETGIGLDPEEDQAQRDRERHRQWSGPSHGR